MAKKSVRKPAAKTRLHPLENEIPSLLNKIRQGSKASSTGATGFLYVLGVEDRNKISQLIDELAPRFQKAQLKKNTREFVQFLSERGPIWILSPRVRKGPFSHQGRLEESNYSWMRDQVGSLVGFFKAYQLENVEIELQATTEEQERGLFVALEMAAYQYRNTIEGLGLADFPKISFQKFGEAFSKEILSEAQALGSAVNMARHLVNTPPNFLNPETMADFVKRQFSKAKNMKIEIWDERRLAKENMNLHLGVGRGAEHGPRLVHLKYRPGG
ncbi:MAG: hypothetical protein ACXWC9_11410, partial [Pseudobdellovibrionaceae bacterium]